MKKAIRILCVVMVALAFMLAVCTVGASDANDIVYGQFVAQILISMLVMALGYIGLKVTE